MRTFLGVNKIVLEWNNNFFLSTINVCVYSECIVYAGIARMRWSSKLLRPPKVFHTTSSVLTGTRVTNSYSAWNVCHSSAIVVIIMMRFITCATLHTVTMYTAVLRGVSFVLVSHTGLPNMFHLQNGRFCNRKKKHNMNKSISACLIVAANVVVAVVCSVAHPVLVPEAPEGMTREFLPAP